MDDFGSITPGCWIEQTDIGGLHGKMEQSNQLNSIDEALLSSVTGFAGGDSIVGCSTKTSYSAETSSMQQQQQYQNYYAAPVSASSQNPIASNADYCSQMYGQQQQQPQQHYMNNSMQMQYAAQPQSHAYAQFDQYSNQYGNIDANYDAYANELAYGAEPSHMQQLGQYAAQRPVPIYSSGQNVHMAGPYAPVPTGHPYQHSSPAGSSHTSGSDESDEFYNYGNYKLSPPAGVEYDARMKRGRQGKKRKPKRDPNEPQKPVSAYALFFRDTQAAIKGQNPNASFGEVSKIVASMWDSLDAESKTLYKQKTETAKKEYLKQLAAYRASLVSKGCNPSTDSIGEFSLSPRKMSLQTPDSTTGGQSLLNLNQDVANSGDIGEKSLASLIAEPTPQQVLTATTTLTVPQSYLPPPARKQSVDTNCLEMCQDGQVCIRSGCHQPSIDDPQWDREYCSNECVVTHCRDVFGNWIANQQQQVGGTYAPV